MDLAREPKKKMEHESDGYTNWKLCPRYRHQMIGTGTGGFGNERTSGDHPNYSIVAIGQNTKKSPGNLWETCYHSDSSGKASIKADVKNSQKSKVIYIYIYIYVGIGKNNTPF